MVVYLQSGNNKEIVQQISEIQKNMEEVDNPHFLVSDLKKDIIIYESYKLCSSRCFVKGLILAGSVNLK